MRENKKLKASLGGASRHFGLDAKNNYYLGKSLDLPDIVYLPVNHAETLNPLLKNN